MFTRLALTLALAAAACHHDAPPPAAPADVPPLPPASGTPIGYLLDEATALKLTDVQLGKLQEIDRGLAASLDEIDTQLRAQNKPTSADAAPPMRRGRHGGGGMGGSVSAVTSADAGRLTEARASDVRDALHRAFAILDDTQRTAATKLLDDHGVDLDAGRPTAAKAAAPTEAGGDDTSDDGSGEP